MFLIPIVVRESPVDGQGVFVEQDVVRGTRIYQHEDLLDRNIMPAEFQKLSSAEQARVKHFGYLIDAQGTLRVDHDEVRYINFSTTPNIGPDDSGALIALRDIARGEELFEYYRQQK